MNTSRFRFLFRLVILLSLITALLPATISTAQQVSPAKLECPQYDVSMLKVPGFMKSLPPECRGRNVAEPVSFAQSMSTLLAAGGPDDFGYTFDDTVPFNWIYATNDSGLNGDESVSAPFDIGFTFPFYGFNYSQLFIHTNGFLTFDPIDGCCFFTPVPIPNPAPPNNYIAPFWDDLVVGAPYNSGAIYYERGGVAPDRYLVVEWRNVTTYYDTNAVSPFTFEVILYENGDILVQHESLPVSYFSGVGIENNLADDGLTYHFSYTGLSAPKTILFIHPTGSIARVSVTPRNTGKFASTTTNTNFAFNFLNLGTAGTDTYNLSMTSSWPATLYQDGCVTPLTDTNADTVIDTGPLPEGASTTICASFTTPAGADVGDSNPASMIATSTIDPAKAKDVSLNMAISAPFALVLEDYENAAMAFQINGPEGPTTSYVTDDFYFANGLVTMQLPDGRYVYAWRKPAGNFPDSHSNIEFTLLNADGSISLPVTQLTNNVGTGQTYDYEPAVAVAPNGNIGFIWYRWIVDNNSGQYNYNIFFAMVSNTGALLYGPTNITNNNLWDNFDNADVPHFFNPAIAASGDNRFVLSWRDYRTDFGNTIWYSTRNTDGTDLFAPTEFATGSSYGLILNPLTGDKVMLTLVVNSSTPAFAVIRSDGTISKPLTPLGGVFPLANPDAVVLSNGTVAVAWPSDFGVALDILDAVSYDVTTGPVFAEGVLGNHSLSITRDASDHIIMTWAGGEDPFFSRDDSVQAFYALADSTGTFITDPMPFRISAAGVLLSQNGQGNAPILSIEPPDMEVHIDIVPGSSVNVIYQTVPLITVAILSSDGFDAVNGVDRSSLTFGKTGDEGSLSHCLSKQGRDVNGDGRGDLICYFHFSATGIVLGDTQAMLRGQTLNGTAFEGTDSIIVRPRPPKK